MYKPSLISVDMPVYNGEKYLKEAIFSLLNQTLDYFELLISDNALTDGIEDICRTLAKNDKRISGCSKR